MKEEIKKYMESIHGACEITFTNIVIDPLTFKPSIGVMVNGNPVATYNPETICDEISMCGEIKDIGMHLVFIRDNESKSDYKSLNRYEG